MAEPKQKAKTKLPSGRHRSQIKRQRQNPKIAQRNQIIRSDVRTFIKKLRKAVESKDKGLAKQALADAIRKIDKAVSKGIFHQNNGSRKISRLSKLVSTLGK
jgi:small subunit ribosomal protein S20